MIDIDESSHSIEGYVTYAPTFSSTNTKYAVSQGVGFAMYEVKQAHKNGFNFFNEEHYCESINQLARKKEFNDMLVHEMIIMHISQ